MKTSAIIPVVTLVFMIFTFQEVTAHQGSKTTNNYIGNSPL